MENKMYLKSGLFVDFIFLNDKIYAYDYFNGSREIIDEKNMVQILKHAFSGVTINTLENLYGLEWGELLSLLLTKKLVIITSDIDYYKDELSFGHRLAKFHNVYTDMQRLKKITINVNSKCGYSADGCDFSNRALSCMGCIESNAITQDNSNVLLHFIREAAFLGLEEINLTGSDPLNNYSLVKRITDEVYRVNPYIRITINSGLSNYNSLVEKLLVNRNIFLNYQVCEANKDLIMNIVPILKESNIIFKVIFNHKINCNHAKYLDNLGVQYVDNTINECDETLSIKLKDIGSIEGNTIAFSTNLCFYGKIFVDEDGGVSVCEKYDCFANIHKDSIQNIMSKAIEKWLDPNLDNEKCIQCDIKPYCNSCIKLRSLKGGECCNIREVSTY